jgi:hypothetical protein
MTQVGVTVIADQMLFSSGYRGPARVLPNGIQPPAHVSGSPLAANFGAASRGVLAR